MVISVAALRKGNPILLMSCFLKKDGSIFNPVLSRWYARAHPCCKSEATPLPKACETCPAPWAQETLSWDFASSGRRPAVSWRKCTSPPRPSTNLKPSFLSKYVSRVLPTSPELKNYLVSALWKWLCSKDRLCWTCGQFSSHFWLQCLLFSNKEG